MLKLENVDAKYASFKALDGVSMDIEPGELVVLLGSNGAGKTTLFNTISGLLKPAAGRIHVNGRDMTGSKPSALVQAGVVQCAEGRKLFPDMSVLKNLMLGGYVHRRDRAGMKNTLEHVLAMFPILDEKKNEAAGSLSGGQQQMVALGRALMGRPKLLLLDEPSLGLAPLVVKQVFETIKTINAEGTTVLLAEQNAYAALKIATRAYVIENGRLVMQGDRDEMLGNEAIRKAYIGA
ncbi:ABC transporter ATP-binding protein [Salinisphaera aquimarina]|uniref:ABC transporter ATP-binding protein n=1 Tax=Salinisphaera aquimarina TaxID=2094031 RepID=A0ABV7EX09_9GAMM